MRSNAVRFFCIAVLTAATQARADADASLGHQVQATAGLGGEPTPWRPFEGRHVRLEADGHLSCFSLNAQDCSLESPDNITRDRWQPLSCGTRHRARWGSTGYDTAGHWCNGAYATLFAKWQDYTLLGWPLMLATSPGGDTLCLSMDGVTCSPAEPGRRASTMPPVRPVVCGQAMRKQTSITGYSAEDRDHWCQSPEIVWRTEGIESAFTLPDLQGSRQVFARPVPALPVTGRTALLIRFEAQGVRQTRLEMGFPAAWGFEIATRRSSPVSGTWTEGVVLDGHSVSESEVFYDGRPVAAWLRSALASPQIATAPGERSGPFVDSGEPGELKIDLQRDAGAWPARISDVVMVRPRTLPAP